MKEDLPIYKIDINEFDESGIDFISLVMNPAIMVKGLAFATILPPCHDYCKCEIVDGSWTFGSSEGGPCEFCVENKNQFDRDKKTFQFTFNEEKQIIAGPAIIPDLNIYRYDPELGEYYVTFTKDVIERMVEKFNKTPKQDQINLDHSSTIAPAFIKGSWIIEDEEFDKSKAYGFNLPVGTWFIEVKVTDPEFWKSEIKDKGKFGFSIEGLLGLKFNVDKNRFEFESYNDYPQAASENAERALRIRDENPNLDCGTPVGWARANQLAKGENISEETIARMSSFARHYENSKGNPNEDCGALMWLAWGGTEGIEWAGRKLEQIRVEQSDNERLSKDKKKKFEEVIDQIEIEINNNKNQKMKKRLKFAEYTLDNGVRISVEGELAVGSAVYVILEDGSLEQAPEGEHMLEDGTTIFVDAEGLINEVRSAETTAVAEGEATLAVTPEEVTSIISEVMQILEPRFEEMRMVIAELATRIETLESHEVEPVSVDESMEKFSRTERITQLKVLMDALTPLNKNK